MTFPKDYCVFIRQPRVQSLILKTLAVALAYLSWAFSLGIAHSQSWRVWEFNSTKVATLYLGLWKASYVETIKAAGLKVPVAVTFKLNSSWGIPDEIYYGQDLLLLANFLTPVALVFSTLAVWASWRRAPYPLFFRTCYNTAALHLGLAGGCLTLTVAWNFIADLSGRSALELPLRFPVNKDMIFSKHITYVLPLGMLACLSSLLGVVLFAVDSCGEVEEEAKDKREMRKKRERPRLSQPKI